MSRFSIITGTGSYIPERVVKNEDFLSHEFCDADGKRYSKSNSEIIKKFEGITGIKERRYVTDDLVTSDIAYLAAKDALESSGSDKEALDYIIVAHNFGDVRAGNKRSDFVPTIASRVKHKLKIVNPRTIAYDVPFGCPGWLQGVIQVNYYLKSGDAKKAMVIGAETLSRVSDPYDRDSMIYSDGAGATILEAIQSQDPIGILAHATRTDALEHAFLLRMEESYGLDRQTKFGPSNDLLLKMNGHRLYEYALKTVPLVVKESIDKAGLGIGDISKALIHQANEKMDEAIMQRLFRLYGQKEWPKDIMPMTISWLGNSSVATLPTMLDLILKDKLDGHGLASGEYIILVSVGAGMNVNSIVYKIP
jgi:3-oxoacyl-[acyl-carrier-protein] synthase-3